MDDQLAERKTKGNGSVAKYQGGVCVCMLANGNMRMRVVTRNCQREVGGNSHPHPLDVTCGFEVGGCDEDEKDKKAERSGQKALGKKWEGPIEGCSHCYGVQASLLPGTPGPGWLGGMK